MNFKGRELPKNFVYVCGADRNDNFTIFANILEENNETGTVTIERYQNFGMLQLLNSTIPRSDFEHYYKKIADEDKIAC